MERQSIQGISHQQKCTSRSEIVSENSEEYAERGESTQRFRRTSWTSTLTYPSVIRRRGVGVQRTVCIVLLEQWDPIDNLQSNGRIETTFSESGKIQSNTETFDQETDQVTRKQGTEVFDTGRFGPSQSIPESQRDSEILSTQSRQRITMERNKRQSRKTSKNKVLSS